MWEKSGFLDWHRQLHRAQVPNPKAVLDELAKVVTVTSRVVALALGLAPIGVIKRASRLND